MIPDWNITGLIPPIMPGVAGHSDKRSPYSVTSLDIVNQFSTTKERYLILKGFLEYRQDLYNHGVKEGFQWLNGSFMQDIERQESRPPNDMDVVTFFVLPENLDDNKKETLQQLFDTDTMKDKYKVDAYPFVLNHQITAPDIKMISYWYSMWSHTRDGIWKGFVQVVLSETDDTIALNTLQLIARENGYE